MYQLGETYKNRLGQNVRIIAKINDPGLFSTKLDYLVGIVIDTNGSAMRTGIYAADTGNRWTGDAAESLEPNPSTLFNTLKAMPEFITVKAICGGIGISSRKIATLRAYLPNLLTGATDTEILKLITEINNAR